MKLIHSFFTIMTFFYMVSLKLIVIFIQTCLAVGLLFYFKLNYVFLIIHCFCNEPTCLCIIRSTPRKLEKQVRRVKLAAPALTPARTSVNLITIFKFVWTHQRNESDPPCHSSGLISVLWTRNQAFCAHIFFSANL